jgi:TIR domain
MPWFLSYHTPDQGLAERLKAAIERKDPTSSVFFAPSSLRAGGAWTAQLAEALAEADAFILLFGEAGVGKWQVPEYDEALDRWVKSGRTFPLIVILIEGQTAPGLPFLRQLHWIVTPPIRRQRRISRGSSTERPAAARARPSYGATPLPIAASKRWRRRTATISSAGFGKSPWRSRRSPRRAGCRC